MLLAILREWFGIDNRSVQLCLNNSPPHYELGVVIVRRQRGLVVRALDL